mgnify:CR=1 FL=1
MRMLTVSIQNVMKISELVLDVSGNHLALIGGKNGQGKTSTLQAFLMTLCGKRGMDWPEVPLAEGESHAECVITFALADDGSDDDVFPDMSQLIVSRTWDRQRDGSIKEGLTITDETGQKSASPQQILNDLFRTRSFNPLQLETLDKKQLRAMLMDLVGLGDEYDAIKKKSDREFAERTVLNANGKKLKAQLDGMPFHKDAPAAESSVQAIIDELNDANKRNADVTAKRSESELALKQLEGNGEKIKVAREKLEAAETKFKADKLIVDKLVKASKKLAFVETDEISARLDSVEDDNAKVRCNAQYTERMAELEAAREERDKLTKSIEAGPAKLQAMLEKAEWPVDGLSVDDEGVLYNGLPVLQASRAERIRLWCRVSAALNPKLRLLVFPDGNDLDNDSLMELDAYLEETDFQAIVEFVTRSKDDEDRCVVVLEDGHDAKVKPDEEF